MSPHDPFGGDSDRTIMKPAGGGLGAQQPQSPASPQPPQPPPKVPGDVVIAQAGSNPLLIHSAPLFALANQLRASVAHPDPLRLQAHVAQEIVNFENHTRQAGEAQAPDQARWLQRRGLCPRGPAEGQGHERQWD